MITNLCFLSCQLFKKVLFFWQMGQLLGNNMLQFSSFTSQMRFWQDRKLPAFLSSLHCLSLQPLPLGSWFLRSEGEGFPTLLGLFNGNSSFISKHTILTSVHVHLGMGSSPGTVKTRLPHSTVHWSLDLVLQSTGTQTTSGKFMKTQSWLNTSQI